MMYEISKESFKQRLEERLNFQFIDVTDTLKNSIESYKDVHRVLFNTQFLAEIKSKNIGINTNVIIFSLDKHSKDAKKAAELLKSEGFHFVYFYIGNPEDVILEKGLN